MMRFREFYQSDLVDLDVFLESVAFKGSVTRDVEAVRSALDTHLRQHAKGGEVSYQMIVDKIRHQFTTYDTEWRALDAKRGKMDRCDYLIGWNEIVTDASILVDKFIKVYVLPNLREPLLEANYMWEQNKMKPIPPECEEGEDDPRLWRTGYRR